MWGRPRSDRWACGGRPEVAAVGRGSEARVGGRPDVAAVGRGSGWGAQSPRCPPPGPGEKGSWTPACGWPGRAPRVRRFRANRPEREWPGRDLPARAASGFASPGGPFRPFACCLLGAQSGGRRAAGGDLRAPYSVRRTDTRRVGSWTPGDLNVSAPTVSEAPLGSPHNGVSGTLTGTAVAVLPDPGTLSASVAMGRAGGAPMCPDGWGWGGVKPLPTASPGCGLCFCARGAACRGVP